MKHICMQFLLTELSLCFSVPASFFPPVPAVQRRHLGSVLGYWISSFLEPPQHNSPGSEYKTKEKSVNIHMSQEKYFYFYYS